MIRTLTLAALLASSAIAAAQVPAGNSAPQPVPYADTIPAPQDVPYPGTLTLDVDATNTDQGIISAHETIPVAKAGPMVLLYPKWLPGNHSPSGQIDKLAGLHVRSGGRELAWTRDPVDVFAFHIDVPQGAKRLDIDLQFLSATKPDQGPIVMTPDILRVQWNSVSLYPAGYFTRQIPITATVKYPAGFTAAAGLPSRNTGSNYAYQTTNYEILVDSPTLAGRYYKAFALSPRVTLDTFADSPGQLVATPEQIDAHKRLVDQAVKLFGAQHYDNYHFLFSISDRIGGIGLEHHRSSEDGTKAGFFTEWKDNVAARNLLPHEYTHSWDGKFRRGADLWTPNFDVPMRDSLLWVYEGQTQFWGYVLQARSGLATKEEMLDMLAQAIASYDRAPARQWRPLIDTTNDPIISQRRPKGWVSYQRSEDYYVEGAMVWMEVDSMLRAMSGGTKSIDDFARAFFGVRDGDWGELTYNFDDVVATLNGVQPYDWAGFLRQRLTETGKPAPTAGFAANGYTLGYTPEPSPATKKAERGGIDALDSAGLAADKDGNLTSVIWASPAFKAGLDTGGTILAVGDGAFSPDRLRDAIVAAKGSKEPIRLTIKADDRVRTVAIDYHGGPRYPHLVKTSTGETGLDRLLAPR
ncbi:MULTISPECIES: peptidase M61 [unclassified Sphingomonas]|uniref:M61 family metallopeptidase n=1 Tax=unclassified Sphingomonas TaxID=196159 RepID=UPI00226A160D|nr:MULTISPECIES: peptidase M61 [unclassified Sphingomonas]